MATPSSVAKKAANQTRDILAAVEGLVVDVAELKAAITSPEIIELEAIETVDRTGEIMAANGQAFAEAAEQSRRILEAVGMVIAEMITLRTEVAELKAEIAIVKRMQETQNQTQAQPATTRKTKK